MKVAYQYQMDYLINTLSLMGFDQSFKVREPAGVLQSHMDPRVAKNPESAGKSKKNATSSNLLTWPEDYYLQLIHYIYIYSNNKILKLIY